MKPFIHDDFLLQGDAARELYHRHAQAEPIYDYHCHLPQALIAADHQFADLAEIWLGGDHYKWRAMRANGVPERFCTGEATPREKFDAWCATVPHTLGNPLYHWSHLELMRYFGIDEIINPASADRIWQLANEKLATMRVHDILRDNQVAVICTTDDPAESLDDHARIAALGIKTRVYPTFRPDKALGVNTPAAFNAWLEKLGGSAKQRIATFDDLLGALKKRHDDFHAAGGRLSDHGLETALAEPCTHAEAVAIFAAARVGRAASPEEWAKYGSYLMLQFGRWDAAKGWTKQLHLGALRNNNTRLLKSLGADTGFDSIGDFPQARSLGRYLDALDTTGELPRTVLYNLNPADNYVFATMAGNYQDGSVAGKVQFGSGWWFLDQKEAMEWQMNALANLGLLSRFVGMLTDSRSFLSYTRHEYFRRVLCNLLGAQIERGELPADLGHVGGMVKNICFANARDFFRLELDPQFSAHS
ncbi:MAG: glucuronate isomerase [Cephaloticoccus sp.]|nr:glucuronate isomerase [Cephaloticoccus sp.]MCF7759509.1 glucuronate isomerase [Cephaloticoccus sp.]